MELDVIYFYTVAILDWIVMYDRKILEQKLDYIHLNPLQEHWNLVTDPNEYLYSSCSFYEREDKRYNWLTHYMDVI